MPEGLEYVGKACFSGSGLEEILFPASVRVIDIGVFLNCEQLRHVKLNEGLEVLGEEYGQTEKERGGTTFSKSGIESAKTPSSLKEIKACAFAGCKSLTKVEFAEGLERIGFTAFGLSGVEDIVLPASTRIVGAQAFAACKQLRTVRLNEGLEVLGAEENFLGKTYSGSVFQESAVESIAIPSTLRVVGQDNFRGCARLRLIEFLGGSEVLGGHSDVQSKVFRDIGIGETALSSTLMELPPDAL